MGGTLHDATIEEWRAASGRNRLATAADWAATLLESEALDWESANGWLRSRRPLAEQLVACADTAPTVAGEPDYVRSSSGRPGGSIRSPSCSGAKERESS